MSQTDTADAAIQATSEDASTSKKFAVQKGYWNDPYITHMVHGITGRKQPEINRGYFARTEAIWLLMCDFIKATDKNCQIVSLGAGLDTTYWRLHGESLLPQLYIEVDFRAIVAKKIRCISHRAPLRTILANFAGQKDPAGLHCDPYHLVSCDLRNLAELEEKLNSCNVNYRLPTLFLAECVLVYMEPDESQAIIQFVADKFKDAVFINYEQLNMEDAFGKVMINNLKARQCSLKGASVCTTKRVQEERFLNCGFTKVFCRDMWTVYNRVPGRRRVEELEMLDEAQLLQQLLEHYCLVIAIKLTSHLDLRDLTVLLS